MNLIFQRKGETSTIIVEHNLRSLLEEEQYDGDNIVIFWNIIAGLSAKTPIIREPINLSLLGCSSSSCEILPLC